MSKKIIQLFLISLILVLLAAPVLAVDNSVAHQKEVNVYFFWAYGCPHCTSEELFLEKLTQKYSNLKIQSFEIIENKNNLNLLKKVGEKLNADISGVPFTVIGEKYFIGWYNEQTTGALIENTVQLAFKNNYQDTVQDLISTPGPKIQGKETIPEKIKVPLLGEIKIRNLSLPVLTIVMGGLDGFNPCAMWVLIFLIGLLLGMRDKKRMWTLGITFIVSSAFVYFLFMTAWLNLILFLGFVLWVRIIIGLMALVSGGYNLKEYFVNKSASCKAIGVSRKKRIIESLKKITSKKQFLLALIGIIIIAFAINLVELVCSAGLPVVYTQILTLTHLARWQYFSYLLLYIFIFMLDDLIVFSVAMITLQSVGLTNKYSRFSKLIGGIIMLIIGILLIFKPGWLMFG